jgi:hypothetical protein
MTTPRTSFTIATYPGELRAHSRVQESVADYHTERHPQGIGGHIIGPMASPSNDNATLGPILSRSRLGGLLNYYYRDAA